MPTSSEVVDWLNENEQRAYPLQEFYNRMGSLDYSLSDNVILDAQLLGSNIATLTSIVSTNSDVIFSISGQPTTFTIPKTGPFPFYLRHFTGLLVVGQAVADIPEGAHVFNIPFESSVCFDFSEEWLGVTTLQFDDNIPLTGDVELIEGIQSKVDVRNSILTLGAGKNFGMPLGCENVGTFPQDCPSIISYINGVSSDTNNHLSINRGNDIIILDDPENHRIFVGLSFTEGDICKTININPEI